MDNTRHISSTFLKSTLIILSLPLLLHAQIIQIHDITNNAGALILQRGEGRVITGYNRLLHTIDFTQFEISLSFIENVISQFQNSTSDFSEIIKIKIREIKFLLNTLHMKPSRNKRSINMLGSAIKFVTGNLDSEDLHIINSKLDDLRKTGNSLIKQNNRQISINSKFENRINLMHHEIKNQQNVLRKILGRDDYIVTENQKILTIFQLDTFSETLKSIEYSLMLAKTNIVSNLILSPNEMETIAQEIRKQGLKVHDLDETSNYLTTTVLYKGSTLIISVNIPQLLQTKFNRVIIEPLPLGNRTIKLKYKTAFVNRDEIMAITSQCRESTTMTICERRQLVNISDDPCEAPLIRETHGKCNFMERSPSTEIRTVSSGMLLLTTVHQDVPFNSTCGISSRNLTGIHLITFQNCSLYINNELYENYEFSFHQPIVLPLQLLKIKPQHIERHVNISELQELHIQNKQHMETVEWKHNLGLASLSIAVTFIVAFLVIGTIKIQQFIKIMHCSGRAILKGSS
ncbi:uncharacterized protein LOC134219532 [Armigeres subalbatus]|uniref:uncharacterized protein LOC134219532 n=1 Tax=Armigeres subalbatus TaxID=124917 RepID=UPI002ECFDAB2